MNTAAPNSPKALVVHGDIGSISGLQDALSRGGCEIVAARDLPTALLAATHNFFDVIVISSRVSEEGDGWPLAGVMHLIFPRAYIGVIARDRNVCTLQAAINHGATQVFETKSAPAEIAGAILNKIPTSSKRVQ
jgi:DNA-binding NtrC family response regulator